MVYTLNKRVDERGTDKSDTDGNNQKKDLSKKLIWKFLFDDFNKAVEEDILKHDKTI